MDHTSTTADGKWLVFKRWWVQRSVYVANVQSDGWRIAAPTRLTQSEGNEVPRAWTADNKAVLFVSNRTGSWGIFRQSLHEDTAQPLVTGLENPVTASISPDGNWVLYVIPTREGDSKNQLLRIPINGGPPQPVLSGNIFGQHCAESPAAACAVAEHTQDYKQLIFTSFDPVKGRGAVLTRFSIDPNAFYVWDLSPEGTRIAIYKLGEGRIHILSARGQTPLEITAKGWRNLETLNWDADGRGFFAASRTPQTSVLLHIDLRGVAHHVWEQKGTLGNEQAGTLGIASPDGRHLAIMGFTLDGNMWMMENF
jgi:Tol biopolymer transport system component